MKKDFYLILHDVRSAYNVGSIFRTADAIGVSKIYISGYTPSPADGKKIYKARAEKMIAKTALGAQNYVSWKKIKNISKLIKDLKNQKVEIVALEQNPKSVNYAYFKPKLPLALIVGNEPLGIDKKVLDQCDAILEIPMRGKKESLNVAVAVGIAGYEIAKKL